MVKTGSNPLKFVFSLNICGLLLLHQSPFFVQPKFLPEFLTLLCNCLQVCLADIIVMFVLAAPKTTKYFLQKDSHIVIKFLLNHPFPLAERGLMCDSPEMTSQDSLHRDATVPVLTVGQIRFLPSAGGLQSKRCLVFKHPVIFGLLSQVKIGVKNYICAAGAVQCKNC
mmetsp:Transcript_20401/g.47708  ORF Transcript_20401/g.47708 Transcript_20401/m.47708 type:complete len:168 (+) Transcript_20401:485-988(+)